MHSSLPAATKAQKDRFQRIQEIGCLCCILKVHIYQTQAEIHHLIDGGKRLGHWHTVALCPWHHRGVPNSGFSEKQTREAKGPSLAKEPGKFKEAFGEDKQLLDKQNKILRKYLMSIGMKDHLAKLKAT